MDSAPTPSPWPCAHDSIIVDGLQLPHGVLAPNAWGEDGNVLQPGSLWVRLRLRGAGFASAARSDALDASTVHYGRLAKAIRQDAGAEGRDGIGIVDALAVVVSAARRMGLGGDHAEGTCAVADVHARLKLQKAGLFADAVFVERDARLDRNGAVAGASWRVGFTAIRLAALVGINAHERRARQPLVADFECGWDDEATGSGRGHIQDGETTVHALFAVERELLRMVDGSAFETLEALAQHCQARLLDEFLAPLLPSRGPRRARGWMRLRLSKPRAIAFADAPAVEVVRRVFGEGEGECESEVASTAQKMTLQIVRPYE